MTQIAGRLALALALAAWPGCLASDGSEGDEVEDGAEALAPSMPMPVLNSLVGGGRYTQSRDDGRKVSTYETQSSYACGSGQADESWVKQVVADESWIELILSDGRWIKGSYTALGAPGYPEAGNLVVDVDVDWTDSRWDGPPRQLWGFSMIRTGSFNPASLFIGAVDALRLVPVDVSPSARLCPSTVTRVMPVTHEQVRARVVRQDGSGLQRARVDFYPAPEGSIVARAYTDQNGQFAVDEGWAFGEYGAIIEADGGPGPMRVPVVLDERGITPSVISVPW